jgi:hypothetical protein
MSTSHEHLRRKNAILFNALGCALGLDASTVDASTRIAPTGRAFARPAGSIQATKDLSPSTVRSPDGAKRTPGRLLNESKPLIQIRFSRCVQRAELQHHGMLRDDVHRLAEFDRRLIFAFGTTLNHRGRDCRTA